MKQMTAGNTEQHTAHILQPKSLYATFIHSSSAFESLAAAC